MRKEQEIRERLARHEFDLAGWQEPDGFLVREEPDEHERRIIREQLEATVLALRWVLADEPWPAVHEFAEWPGRPKLCAGCGRGPWDPLHAQPEEDSH